MDFQTAAWHVAKAHPHGLSQIRLLKLIWLAELKHFQKTGHRLTDVNWFRYDHGPYTKGINAVKQDETQVFQVANETTPNGFDALVIRAASPAPPHEAPVDELKSLHDTLWLYEKFTTEELLDEVYEDPFFEGTPHSHDFKFERLPDFRQIELTPERLKKLEQALGA
jgi:hypothetical protein